jgi:hypothetical protein
MENAGMFHVHLVYFTAIGNILWPFGIFCDHLAYFPRCTKKNLATLNFRERREVLFGWLRLYDHNCLQFLANNTFAIPPNHHILLPTDNTRFQKSVVTRATTISKVYFNRSNIFTDVRR